MMWMMLSWGRWPVGIIDSTWANFLSSPLDSLDTTSADNSRCSCTRVTGFPRKSDQLMSGTVNVMQERDRVVHNNTLMNAASQPRGFTLKLCEQSRWEANKGWTTCTTLVARRNKQHQQNSLQLSGERLQKSLWNKLTSPFALLMPGGTDFARPCSTAIWNCKSAYPVISVLTICFPWSNRTYSQRHC